MGTANENKRYKGLEYRFLKPYVDTNTQANMTSITTSRRRQRRTKTQWILDWWKANESEYTTTLQTLSPEVDIERLFSHGVFRGYDAFQWAWIHYGPWFY
jgi:hypothetical protein